MAETFFQNYRNVALFIVEYYIWNSDNQVIGIADSSGVFQKGFIYGTKPHVPDYMIMGGDKFKIITNHLGSPVVVVNSSTGVIAQEIHYDEWGKILSDTNPGFTPFGFAGCLYDQDTKLCRFGARDYDASIGRWLSKDPILFAGGDTNLYGYVMQDPINYIDPEGTEQSSASEMVGEKLYELGMHINRATTFKDFEKMSPKYFHNVNQGLKYQKYLNDRNEKEKGCTSCPCN